MLGKWTAVSFLSGFTLKQSPLVHVGSTPGSQQSRVSQGDTLREMLMCSMICGSFSISAPDSVPSLMFIVFVSPSV